MEPHLKDHSNNSNKEIQIYLYLYIYLDLLHDQVINGLTGKKAAGMDLKMWNLILFLANPYFQFIYTNPLISGVHMLCEGFELDLKLQSYLKKIFKEGMLNPKGRTYFYEISLILLGDQDMSTYTR